MDKAERYDRMVVQEFMRVFKSIPVTRIVGVRNGERISICPQNIRRLENENKI